MKVFSRAELCGRSQFGALKPLVVGVALRGVRALAVSAKGFGGVGPVFRVDRTVGPDSESQPGRVRFIAIALPRQSMFVILVLSVLRDVCPASRANVSARMKYV